MPRLTTTFALALALALGLTACGGTDEPTVADQDLQATPQGVAEEEPSEAPSPTEDPAPEETGTDDATEEPTPEPPTFEEACAGREDEAFIEVLTPQPDAEVGQTFTFTGCGNTFEAGYVYRVEGADGEVLADGHGMMGCGTGCVGEFEQEITVDATGPITLVVFEESPEDGSEQHVVEVPLEVAA